MEATETDRHPLLNVHLLEFIFGECNVATLLQCRLVCTTWNSEASRSLEKNLIMAHVKGKQAIPKCLDCLKTANNHPFSSFSIELPQESLEAEHQDVFSLINLLKDRLKVVKFEYELPMSTHVENQQVPEDQIVSTPVIYPEDIIELPVLTSLQIFSTNIFPPRSPIQLPRIFNMLKTPSLLTLSVQHLFATECSDMIVKFINSADCLFSLRMPCAEFPQIVGQVNLQNLKVLDICDLFHGSCATNDTIHCIRDNCPQLEVLSIEFGCRVSFDWIFKLFETLSKSLTELKIIIQDKNLLSRNIQRTNFYFPRLPKLQSLFLRFSNPGLVYYIDEMPLLKSLELETPWTRKLRGNLFPEGKVYENLKILKVSEKLTYEDVQNIHRLFPNLRSLCASFKCDEALLQVYQKLQELECLIIDRNSDVSDYGICGLPKEKLLELTASKVMSMELDQLEESVIESCSLANLKKLKYLKFVQLGLSWKGFITAVWHLKHLKSLAVQAITLKVESDQFTQNDMILKLLAQRLPKLRHLCIWVRRNSERLSTVEMDFLKSKYPQWDIDITIQTVCTLN